MLNSRIPEGTRIGRTTSDGNCLFHAVSIALFGDESASHLLRLYATFHAMKHQRQILKGVSIILCIGRSLYIEEYYISWLCTCILSIIIVWHGKCIYYDHLNGTRKNGV